MFNRLKNYIRTRIYKGWERALYDRCVVSRMTRKPIETLGYHESNKKTIGEVMSEELKKLDVKELATLIGFRVNEIEKKLGDIEFYIQEIKIRESFPDDPLQCEFCKHAAKFPEKRLKCPKHKASKKQEQQLI